MHLHIYLYWTSRGEVSLGDQISVALSTECMA